MEEEEEGRKVGDPGTGGEVSNCRISPPLPMIYLSQTSHK